MPGDRPQRNVKRWRGGQMVLRWTAAAILEAVKGFRRLKGHRDMPQLVAALRARDQQLGIVASVTAFDATTRPAVAETETDAIEAAIREGVLSPA